MTCAKQWQTSGAAESQHPNVVAASNAPGRDMWLETAREQRHVSVVERNGVTQLSASDC